MLTRDHYLRQPLERLQEKGEEELLATVLSVAMPTVKNRSPTHGWKEYAS